MKTEKIKRLFRANYREMSERKHFSSCFFFPISAPVAAFFFIPARVLFDFHQFVVRKFTWGSR